jgi:hypothetical protein
MGALPAALYEREGGEQFCSKPLNGELLQEPDIGICSSHQVLPWANHESIVGG